MNIPKLTIVQGAATAFTMDAYGGAFTGSETITGVITRGDGQAALLSPTLAWDDYTEGTVTLTVGETDFDTLTPGPYLLLVKANSVLILVAAVALLPNVGIGTPTRALTTPAEAVGLVPSLATSQDDFNVLPLVLEASTRRIEEHCRRKLLLSDYDRLYVPNRCAAVILDSRPVPIISRCQTALGSGIEIRYTGSAQQATVAVAPTSTDVLTIATLTLKSVSSGVATTTTLTMSNYTTVSALVTAIGAVSGWTAETDYGTRAASELFGTPGVYGAKDAAFVIPLYSQQIEQYTLDTRRGRLEFDPGIFNTSSYLPDDVRQVAVRVTYRAGYAYLTADIAAGYEPVPADLKLACVLVTQAMSKGGQVQVSGIKSQTVKDRSYTVNDQATAIPSVAQSILASYMDGYA